MTSISWKKFWSTLMLMILLVMLPTSPGGAVLAQGPVGPAGPFQPEVSNEVQHDISPRLRALLPNPLQMERFGEASARMILPKSLLDQGLAQAGGDPALQTQPAIGQTPDPLFNFEGTSNRNGVVPPDTNGDVSANYYVQWVNLSIQVWQLDRVHHTATSILGPMNANLIWSGFGGPCETTNSGDPIVLYDHLADRWLFSQFSIPNNFGPFYQCLAVSTSGDPTNSWYRYAYEWHYGSGADIFNDYPHLGVWPDGYYMSVNQFNNASTSGSWRGAGVAVFERDKMLLGQAARMVNFDLFGVNQNYGGMLPSDLDGPAPAAGTPNYFGEADNVILPSWSVAAFRIWQFHVDWRDTTNSTFGLSGNPNFTLPVQSFTSRTAGVPQPGTSVTLDPLADRLMHRFQYRNFGTYATLVANHTVDVGGLTAIRWYEFRNSGAGWGIQQQGTYAGDTSNTENRWMASLAMDGAGDIAAGYSVSSSSSTYPSIRYTARLATDTPGTLPQGETTLIAGSGSQLSSSGRWGDYSMLAVDPSDDCTFWYTNEYYPANGSSSWHTRIGSFVLPACLSGGKGTLQGAVTDAWTHLPLAGSQVSTSGYSAQSQADGQYQISGLPAGIYTVTASLYSYQPITVTNVPITSSQTTSRNFALTAIPTVTVSGVVKDGSGQGWPLYARIDVDAPGLAKTSYTDPRTGAYSLSLAQGVRHGLTVTPFSPGYLTAVTAVTPTLPVTTKDILVYVDTGACNAPGYRPLSGCSPSTGGLLVGNVLDGNTLTGLNGATVASKDVLSATAVTSATPGDPAVADGFFALFSPVTGNHAFTASASHYGTLTQTVDIAAGSVTSTTFRLPAGRLAASPASVQVSLGFTATLTRTLTLSNTGGLPVTFSLVAVNAPAQVLQPTGPFAPAARRVSNKRLGAMDASGVFEYTPPVVEHLAAGQVLRSWPTGLTHPWGIGLDITSGDLWVGNVPDSGGEDFLTRFEPLGVRGGDTIPVSEPSPGFSAGLVYNPFTRTFWQLNVARDNCMFELDPVAHQRTGRSICPPYSYSQRGLAFNPLNGSYYAGSWVTGILNHFDGNGVMLDSLNTGLNIAGLAFNPATGHLFVLVNADEGHDVYVLDTNNHYANLGGFDIAGQGDFQQAGMAIGCNGSLWVVNQGTGYVSEVASGETGTCAWSSIPWLTVNPASGSVPAGGAIKVMLSFDASKASGGTSQAQLALSTDTPYTFPSVPVTMNIPAVYDFVLSGPSTVSGDPGLSVTHTILLTNTGNVSGMYLVSTAGNKWNTTAPGSAGPALPGNMIPIKINVQVPFLATGKMSDAVTVTFTSALNPLRTASVRLVTLSYVPRYLFLPALHR